MMLSLKNSFIVLIGEIWGGDKDGGKMLEKESTYMSWRYIMQ